GRRASVALAVPGHAVARGADRPRRGGPARPDGGAVQVRVVVAQVAALLRSGAPPGAAWSRATGVPVDGAGVPDEEALAAVVGGPEHARSVAAATRLALEVGAPLGRVLEAVSDTLVAEAEAQAERDAALAGPRATARVLQWLPAAGALLGWVLGADPVATATDGGAGSAAVGLGLVLLAAGRWWTGRLVAAARRAGEVSS
uniref:type II secretion system F family protein n=1 Tax=Puerhibacterium puerhi TaxID=2692623 RepID=UPI001F16EA43